jgi:hypothetical protein
MVKASAELVVAEMVDAEWPEAHLNLGLLICGDGNCPRPRRNTARRCGSTRTSSRLSSTSLISTGRVLETRRVLNCSRKRWRSSQTMPVSDMPSVSIWCASHDNAGALDLSRRAQELMPENARYAYVYAVALDSTGATAEVLVVLEEVHHRHPADHKVLTALVSIARGNDDFAVALRHAREVLTLEPGDAQLRSLISDLEKKVRP